MKKMQVVHFLLRRVNIKIQTSFLNFCVWFKTYQLQHHAAQGKMYYLFVPSTVTGITASDVRNGYAFFVTRDSMPQTDDNSHSMMATGEFFFKALR